LPFAVAIVDNIFNSASINQHLYESRIGPFLDHLLTSISVGFFSQALLTACFHFFIPMSADDTYFNLPIFFALLPPLGSLFVGTADTWADAALLILAALYLYHLIKVPWELYSKARANLPSASFYPAGQSLSPGQQEALKSLRRHVNALLFLVLMSPLLGGMLLLFLQRFLHSTQTSRLLTPTTIVLYTLTSCIRPLSHVVGMLQARGDMLQAGVVLQQDELSLLKSSLRDLQEQIVDLRMAVVMRSDLEEVEAGVESVARAVRGVGKKGERNVRSVEEKIQTLEGKLIAFEEGLHVLEKEKQESNARGFMMRCVMEPANVLGELVSKKSLLLN